MHEQGWGVASRATRARTWACGLADSDTSYMAPTRVVVWTCDTYCVSYTTLFDTGY